MNRLIHYCSVEAIPFYNCSWKSSEEWWDTGVQRPWLGIPILILGLFYELLYAPVIYIIFKTRLIRYPCYKIIVMLAITDMIAITCSCLITGVLVIQGAVFCSYPTFIYIEGGFGIGTWCISCAITVALFLNRIVSIVFKGQADVIEKRFAYSSMLICVCYFFYVCFCSAPPVYNSKIMAWIPDPLSEEVTSAEASAWYQSSSQTWNNWIFVSCMLTLFTIYNTLVKRLAKGHTSKASRAIFIQCSLICFFNTLTALLYSAIAFVNPGFWILVSGQFVWSINHGVPGLIYVTMNATIRREFKKLFLGKCSKVEDKRSSVHPTNHSRI